MRADRLLKLADFLDELPLEKFNFGIVTNACGTVGCAMGWLPRVFPGEVAIHYGEFRSTTFSVEGARNALYDGAARVFFEIPREDAYCLFTPECEIAGIELEEDATPKQVADRIRAYVAQKSEVGQ